jgi:hypothetical protein
MNLDNFLLTPEEATNLADDLIQQQVYKSGVSISEPANVYVAAVAIIALAVVSIVAIFTIMIWAIHSIDTYGF